MATDLKSYSLATRKLESGDPSEDWENTWGIGRLGEESWGGSGQTAQGGSGAAHAPGQGDVAPPNSRNASYLATRWHPLPSKHCS